MKKYDKKEVNILKTTDIQFTYDEERLDALKVFLEEKDKKLESELMSMMDALYERTVPQKVQFFLEKKGRADNAKTKAKGDFKPT